MTREDFSVGMRVVMIEDDPEGNGIVGDYNRVLTNGMTGTVRAISSYSERTPIGVEWDIPAGCYADLMERDLHNLNGTLDEDFGWWCGVDQLAPLEETEIEESSYSLAFLYGGDSQ